MNISTSKYCPPHQGTNRLDLHSVYMEEDSHQAHPKFYFEYVSRSDQKSDFPGEVSLVSAPSREIQSAMDEWCWFHEDIEEQRFDVKSDRVKKGEYVQGGQDLVLRGQSQWCGGSSERVDAHGYQGNVRPFYRDIHVMQNWRSHVQTQMGRGYRRIVFGRAAHIIRSYSGQGHLLKNTY